VSSLRPVRVTLREIGLRLREPFRISSGVVAERRILLAEVEDADGVVAWSECVAGELPYYSAETVDTAWLALRDWFAPRLLAAELPHPADAREILVSDIRGHRMAAATLEMAVWALQALRDDIPLATLLGGSRSRLDVGISIGIQPSPDALVERARAAVQDGYRRIKLKVRPGADIEFVAAVRAAVGPRVPLSVDANSAYRLQDAAHLRRLDALDLLMIEQPLDPDDLVRHAELQRQLRTPICLDESITSADRAADMIALGSGRIVNIKAGRVGGLAESIAIHDTCARAGVPVWCGGMLESGIGRGYNVALAALPNFSMAGDISPSRRYWERDIVEPEWTMTPAGEVLVPASAGLGITVDRDHVDDVTTRALTLQR
jgi:o-succinylbenzoate synthase